MLSSVMPSSSHTELLPPLVLPCTAHAENYSLFLASYCWDDESVENVVGCPLLRTTKTGPRMRPPGFGRALAGPGCRAGDCLLAI
eukprot:364331-Chlamydomonas_euryale.AAC.3